ncbi:MAG: hypothetical protein AAGH74_05440 [Pseudomonadota bacterium]
MLRSDVLRFTDLLEHHAVWHQGHEPGPGIKLVVVTELPFNSPLPALLTEVTWALVAKKTA